MAIPNMKKDESSIANAPQQMTPACFRITGIAMLPTTEAPVRNLVASIQLQHGINYQNKLKNTFSSKT